MQELLRIVCERLANGEELALATLVSRKGSAPRNRGARLVANASGLVYGTVGGGAGEAAVLEACAEVLRGGASRLLDLTLSNAVAATEGMVCGGEMRLFVEALKPDPATRRFFAAVRAALQDGGGVLLAHLAVSPDPSAGRLLYADGRFHGAVLETGEANALADALATRGALSEPAILTVDGKEYFADPLFLPSNMILAGGGHVAVATAELAAFAGFSVHVMDDRPEFSRLERFRGAASASTVPGFADCFIPFSPDARTHIVIATRGHMYDETVLAQALTTNAGYIGMIGSRKKRDTVYAALRSRGFTEADLSRVRCPVGLAIGAETPEEIAVSIVGECIAHKRKNKPETDSR